MNESLYKENVSKDREIRKLNKDVQQYEQTILSLRNEISIVKYHTPDVSKKDAEVMAGMCCTGAECGDWEPVKDFSATLREEMMSYQERIHKMEANLKASGSDVRALRSANVSLREELHSARGVCAALAQQCQSDALRDQFKDDIIREMRRQLKQAKAQSKEVGEVLSGIGSVKSCEECLDACRDKSRDGSRRRGRCVREQPRRARDPDMAVSLSDDCRSPRLVLSGDDLLSSTCCDAGISDPRTSTPNASSHLELTDTGQSPDVSLIQVERSTSAPILLSEDSISKLEGSTQTLLKQCNANGSFKCVRIQPPEDQNNELFKTKREADNDGRGRGVDSARVYESQSTLTLQDGKSTKVKSEPKRESLIAPESFGRSSEADSPSSCASARAHYYHNKLLATMQILQNKEETVRVQTESLAVAEARIASLTARSGDLKRDIERKAKELQLLRKSVEENRIERSDVSISAHIQEIDNQKNIMTTLQNNLGVIEDLYRECFYETAKQEGLIEMLRNSYLDVRLMDKDKSDQISRLHNVINTQKWSLDKFQDISAEVDNLKVEISNFLNSSNNDSGVWEESIAGSVTEDLQDIAGQLLRLGEILTGDCTCGLQEENVRLRQKNEAMEMQMDVLQQKITDLENNIENKDTADRKYLEQIRAKESELHLIRQQLAAVESDTREKGESCESLKIQLHQTQVLLEQKSGELLQTREQCARLEQTVTQLRDELEHTKEISKQYCALRGSVRTLRAELARALEQCAHLDACHREEVKSLESALWQAQARGATLCEEAQKATRSVRSWTRRRRDLHRDQEEQIKQKESQIRQLEQRLLEGQNDVTLTRASERDACSQCVSARSITSQPSRLRSHHSSCKSRNEGSFTSSGRVRQRQECGFDTSASETGSSEPVSPERPSRMKRFFCENRFCSGTRDMSVQRPERRDAASGSGVASDKSRDTTQCRRCHLTPHRMHSEPSCGSVEEVMCRVESARAALADSLRRWNRADPTALHDLRHAHSSDRHDLT